MLRVAKDTQRESWKKPRKLRDLTENRRCDSSKRVNILFLRVR
jgi:hypothetical protein